MASRIASVAVLVGGAGCGYISGLDGTPSMDPGQDCNRCHTATGSASLHAFTVSGTAYGSPAANQDAGVPGLAILITDGAKHQFKLQTTSVGNFYLLESLIQPVHVSAVMGETKMDMSEPVPPGRSCNECHTVPPPLTDAGYAPAPGRIFVPSTMPGTQP